MSEKRRTARVHKKHGRWYYWLFDPRFAAGMEAADQEDKADGRKTKKRKGMSRNWSVLLLVAMILLYAERVDATYAITVWPAWLGMIFGVIFTLRSSTWRWPLVIAWAIFGFIFVDEFRSYPRGLLPEASHHLRIVSLNCAGGTYTAAQEVKAQQPDIVLFQETCTKEELGRLAKEFFGAEGTFVPGPDASIIARGTLKQIRTPRATNDYVIAEWSDTSGHRLKLMSLRLMPPTMRIDLYDPAAWGAFSKDRESRRAEADRMGKELAALNFMPDVMGGDFNSPADFGTLGGLTKELADSFAETGVGYGATCVNPYPCMVRIDRIYHSPVLQSTRARVVATENSDHRMLVSDFEWQ